MTSKDRLAPALETEGGLDEASAAEPGRTSTLAALEFRDFRLFWFGLVVSNIGSWMQIYGLGWLVVQLAIRDGVPQLAPFYLGLVGLARAIPGLAFGLFGGAVADRADRRRLLMVTQIAAAIVAVVLAALTITEHINIVEVVLISALNSIIFSFDAPTRQAMVPRLVTDRELMSAIGLNSAAFNGATLIGPLIGGILIIPFGVGGLMLINAISYLAVVAALVAIAPQPSETRRRLSMLASIREGLAYIRQDPVLRWVVLLTVATALFTRPYIQLLPAEAQFLGVGALELSWLLAASGVGALAGALADGVAGRLEAARRASRRQRAVARCAAHGVRDAALADRRDGVHRAHELRRDGVPRDGEHADADAHAGSSSRPRDERAHHGLHGLHAAGSDAARIARYGRGDQHRVPRRRRRGGDDLGLCAVTCAGTARRSGLDASTSGRALRLENQRFQACFRPLDRSLDAPYVLEHTF